MKEWKEYKFSELLEDESISYGIVQPGFHVETDSVPIIRVNNIKNGVIETKDVLKVSKEIESKYVRTRLKGGELLITVVGSVGECAIVPENLAGWNVARAVSVARIKKSFNTNFIRYCFQTDDTKFQMYGNTNDTVQPTLNLGLLKELKFNLPNLHLQNTISDVLSSFDDKIDLLHRQNKTLEGLAEVVFREWFVERAREEWETSTLGDIASFFNGKSRPQEVENGAIPIYGGNGVLGYTDISNCTEESIIIGRVGAYCGSLFLERADVWISDNALLTKPKKTDYFYFLFYLLKSLDLNSMAEGSSHPLLTQTLLKSIDITLSSEDRILSFNALAKELWNKIIKNTEQIRTLTQTRDGLLPKLMSGEVRVEVSEHD